MVSYFTIVLYLILSALAIMAYGKYRCLNDDFTDPLTQSFIDRRPWNQYIDGWGLLHFWFFAFLGYEFPSYWLFILMGGALWEGIEMMFKDRPFYLTHCNQKTNWWYGRWEDLVMNTGGLIVGLALRQRGVSKQFFSIWFVLIVVSHIVLLRVRQR
jgi:hypothetical protein